MSSKLSVCIGLSKLSKIICSLLSTNLDIWTTIIDGLADGLVWLQAVCTSPQKAIVVLQKEFFQLNSLHQIKIKTGIRTKEDFIKHSSYLYSYRNFLRFTV